MLSIEKSPQFQKDFLDCKTIIDKIEDEKLKRELADLLNKMIYEARRLDQQHEEIIGMRKLSSMTSDTRSNLNDVRKKLFKKIEDYKKSHL